ncbi:MAG: archaellin/type IV pilin N-terminal domain-containing protein [Nitrosopumilaceae archaeon]|nr:archaellin/type IV pilin N-terminal domain-containing protein [Nitrosopumilaceae archaeon]
MILIKQKSKFGKTRRGITEVISTLLLMSITVAGSATLAYFMNDAFVSGAVSSISTSDVSTKSVRLLAYDTRDSFNLLSMNPLDNSNTASPSMLCGFTCKDNVGVIPDNTGTEFLVLKLKNDSIDSILLHSVIINNVPHSWDSNTKDVQLDANTNDVSGIGKYPADGMFSVIPEDTSSLHQRKNEIPSGGTADIIIKLGPDDSDISLNDGIRILLDIGVLDFAEFVIESGDAR